MTNSSVRFTTFHQISPYIGRLRPELAKDLILSYTRRGQTVLDPFAGSGTVPLEALMNGRGAIAADINPYADLMIKAKMFPPPTLEDALERIEIISEDALLSSKTINIDNIPDWIRGFFHPQTLKEVMAYSILLREQGEYFLLACLMGILHHQRPGFLSFPASHSVPYLRTKKFPKEDYPEMYEYRDVKSRLVRKVERMYKYFLGILPDITRISFKGDATELKLGNESIDAVITSPPYMDALSYGRDNRLRLWFLGDNDYQRYDGICPKNENEFKNLCKSTLKRVKPALRPGAPCIFVLGDVKKGKSSIHTSKLLVDVATKEMKGFRCESMSEDFIPTEKRVRRGCRGTKSETIVVLRNDGRKL